MTIDDLIETKKTLELYGEETVSSMKNILLSNGKSASGKLVQSISYSLSFQQDDIELEFSMEDYGIYVDKGRRPGKMSPISSITPWMKIKGIDLKYAFPIARKIGKTGIKATPFFSSTVDTSKDKLVDDLAQSFSQDVVNYFSKLFN